MKKLSHMMLKFFEFAAIVTNTIYFPTPIFPSDSSGLESLQSSVLVLLSLRPLGRVQPIPMIVFTYRKTKKADGAYTYSR